MKKLTVENMILQYLEDLALDIFSTNYYAHMHNEGEGSNLAGDTYRTFLSLADMGFISRKALNQFIDVINNLKLNDSCSVYTTTTGRVMYRFNEEIGHFEKAC
jgi:hypothetical protein